MSIVRVVGLHRSFASLPRVMIGGCDASKRVRNFATAPMTVEQAYHTLRVHRRSNMKDIKQSYLELAKLYHPDRNTDDESAKEKFIQVQQAYEMIKKNHAPEIVIEHSYRPPTAYEDFEPADKNAPPQYDFTSNQPRGNSRPSDFQGNYRDFMKKTNQSYSAKYKPNARVERDETSMFLPLLLTLALTAALVHFLAPSKEKKKVAR
eukprot:TRINITY_DN10523_c0_g1_i1.p1 TRINITY_DN10523_c0_g1~~TRINITY_DN10523_c0_g1_i1.p1  ORF type:complete len:206 (+),score=56.22 TRINITY_DN10523_c0_g1_i1:50-667(+)